MSVLQADLSADAALNQRVQAFIGKHWARFQRQADASGTAPKGSRLGTPAERAAQIYAKMTNYRFCRQRPAEPQHFLRVIEASIAAQEPIPVVLGHGPWKNCNNCSVSQVDWAEFFTLSHLVWLNEAVRDFHPQGLAVTYYVDDARAEAANDIPACWTQRYIASLRELISLCGLAGSLVHDVISLKELYALEDVYAHLPEAETKIRAWESDPANAQTITLHLEHALRNLPEACQKPPEELMDKATAAAHRYRVYYQAEVLAGLWDQPDRLYGRYGAHAGFWQLFTMRKGSISQPWQGKGCLLSHAAGEKFEPFLLTRSKAERLVSLGAVETGLPLPGFEIIPVYAEPTSVLEPSLALRTPERVAG